jgi:hypothetical protein
MRLIVGKFRHANLSRSDEPVIIRAESDAWMILRIKHNNNRRVHSPQIPLRPTWRFREQIAEVVDDFRDVHRLPCTSIDQTASTTDSNIRAVEQAYNSVHQACLTVYYVHPHVS